MLMNNPEMAANSARGMLGLPPLVTNEDILSDDEEE